MEDRAAELNERMKVLSSLQSQLLKSKLQAANAAQRIQVLRIEQAELEEELLEIEGLMHFWPVLRNGQPESPDSADHASPEAIQAEERQPEDSASRMAGEDSSVEQQQGDFKSDEEQWDGESSSSSHGFQAMLTGDLDGEELSEGELDALQAGSEERTAAVCSSNSQALTPDLQPPSPPLPLDFASLWQHYYNGPSRQGSRSDGLFTGQYDPRASRSGSPPPKKKKIVDARGRQVSPSDTTKQRKPSPPGPAQPKTDAAPGDSTKKIPFFMEVRLCQIVKLYPDIPLQHLKRKYNEMFLEGCFVPNMPHQEELPTLEQAIMGFKRMLTMMKNSRYVQVKKRPNNQYLLSLPEYALESLTKDLARASSEELGHRTQLPQRK